MAAAVLPVPTILNILNDSDDNYFTDQNVEQPQRAKKRRLDHLSWEEKIQRKKLKNRVAAQTSRDRKKAKVEQMEAAIQQLFTKNETILTECEKLRETNERLQAENAELRERLQQHQGAPLVKCQCQSRSVVCAPVSGSTESLLHDDVLRPKGAGAHTAATLGPERALLELRLKILLVCLLCRTCSTSLRANRSISEHWQLTQTLLEDIARDLEGAAAQRTTDQEPTLDTKNIPNQMVGPPPEHLEPSRGTGDDVTLKSDISEYLLLHHNYAKAPRKTKDDHHQQQPSPRVKKLKTIRPKLTTEPPQKVTREETPREVVYGTFDENTNTITILVDEVPLNEVIVGGVDKTPLNVLETLSVDTNTPPTTTSSECSSSPRSDLGYESLDSPLSDLDTTWEQSVSELFPSLF
ncbi:LOW QUALITY PROTEIN: uncharacterized protein LOC126746601 [Anthonomus grandis grandis]|uniref:LOW QUALITY PROTEIN: uncharacterized protein LOC126746601 n=1 Tax=Anthonomus grandis grandis TaxID=2921223 RepID=UPI002165A9BE|nr:LOW QUALITY PROTEIN: uncharacterized protein LOC126746601 [Anthonomus grandis grandis]